MHATRSLEEAARLMNVCNACRYCEGLCAVFPAMEMRRAFSDADLTYLANLCHNCGACYVDCQFAPPHEFDVNVPKVLAEVRAESWRRLAWPAALGGLFARNGLSLALIAAISVAGFVTGMVGLHDRAALFATDGQFYRLMPHRVMAGLFGALGLYAVLALGMSLRNFFGGVGGTDGFDGVGAAHDSATLRYLDGGGVGCYGQDERPTDRRRLFHHLTFYGFLLCFAATCVATVEHYLLGLAAPYGWTSLPKLLGVPGGIGLVVGTAGLMREKARRDAAMVDAKAARMDWAFVVILFAAGLSGLALMVLRQSPAMGLMLGVHLGVVAALFLALPYSKFVHGLYRFAALARYRAERKWQAG